VDFALKIRRAILIKVDLNIISAELVLDLKNVKVEFVLFIKLFLDQL
jgi:hypothetical protein